MTETSSASPRWFSGDAASLLPYSPELSRQIEAAFDKFWSTGEEPTTFALEVTSGTCHIDFRSFEQVTRGRGSAGVEKCLVHRYAPLSSSTECEEFQHRVHWGHAQDPINGKGFAYFDAQISELLEEEYNKYRICTGLKGIMLTSSNGEDYLVDFRKFEQMRLQTRRFRTIFRHSLRVAITSDDGTDGPFAEASTDAYVVPGSVAFSCRSGCIAAKDKLVPDRAEDVLPTRSTSKGSSSEALSSAASSRRPTPPGGTLLRSGLNNARGRATSVEVAEQVVKRSDAHGHVEEPRRDDRTASKFTLAQEKGACLDMRWIDALLASLGLRTSSPTK